MIVLTCQRFPYLKLALVGDAGRAYRRFEAGKLLIEDDDPLRGKILAIAQRDPSITIHEDVLTCTDCGETFIGAGAKGRFVAHSVNAHGTENATPRVHDEARKAAAAYVCDVCSPAQPFADESTLAAHTAALHATPPLLDANDEAIEVGVPRVRQGPVTTAVPAAARRKPKG
jgi:hypothetical protein